MSLPMVGTWVVVVNAVTPFAIHGDEYFELHVSRPNDGSDHLIRVPRHAMQGGALPPRRSRASLSFLMGQVTDVKAVE